MLSKAHNDLITQTGPGTPCGDFLRSYWQPIAGAEEIPLGGAPLPIDRKSTRSSLMIRIGSGAPPGGISSAAAIGCQ